MSCTYKYNNIEFASKKELKEYLKENPIVEATIDLKAKVAMINSIVADESVLPKVYANYYLNWFRDTELVQQGINAYGSVTNLANAVIKNVKDTTEENEEINLPEWWKKFSGYVKDLFKNYSKKELTEIITEALFTNVNISEFEILPEIQKVENQLEEVDKLSEAELKVKLQSIKKESLDRGISRHIIQEIMEDNTLSTQEKIVLLDDINNSSVYFKGVPEGGIITKDKAEAIVKKYFPNSPVDGLTVEFLEREAFLNLTEVTSDTIWGFIKQGKIYVSKTKDGKIYEEVLMHEIFRRIWMHHLSPNERSKAISLASKTFKLENSNVSQDEIVSLLRRKFRQYSINPSENKLRGILRKLYNKVKSVFDFMFSAKSNLDTLLDNLVYRTYEEASNILPNNTSIKYYDLIKEVYGTSDDIGKNVNLLANSYEVLRKLFAEHRSMPEKDSGVVKSVNDTIKDVYFYVQLIAADLKSQETSWTQKYNETGQSFFKRKMEITKFNRATYSSLANPKAYAALVNLILPGQVDIRDTFELLGYDAKGDEFLKGKKRTSLKDEITDNDTENKETHINKTLKFWLSTLALKDSNGKIKRIVNSRAGFFNMIRIARDIIWSENVEDQLSEMMRTAGTSIDKKIILNSIRELVLLTKDRDTYTPPKSDIPIHIPKFYTMADKTDPISGKRSLAFAYSIPDKNGERKPLDKEYTLEELQNDPDVIVVFKPASGKTASNIGFLEKINDSFKTGTGENLDSDLFNFFYKRIEAQNILKGIYNEFASMKELNLTIVMPKWDFGDYSNVYLQSRGIGLNSSLLSIIESSILSKMSTALERRQFVKEAKIMLLRDLKTGLSVQKRFDNILEFLGLKDILPTTEISTENPINGFKGIIDRLEGWKPEDSESDIFSPEEAFLRDNSSSLREISNELANNSAIMKANSQKDSGGNTVYKFINGNFMSRVIDILMDSKDFLGSFTKVGKKLVPKFMQSKYYTAYNIYSKGINKIYARHDFDGAKYDNDNINTPFGKAKNFKSWARFMLMGGIIEGLATKGREYKGVTYNHFVNIMSERKKQFVVETNILSKEDIKKARKLAKDQKNYLNKIIFSNMFKKFSPKFINPILTSEEVKEEAKKLLELMINTRTTVPSSFPIAMLNMHKTYTLSDNTVKVLERYSDKNKFRLLDSEGNLAVNEKAMLEILEGLISNYSVNNYFINEMYFGPEAFYGNEVQILKRGAGPSAPSSKPKVWTKELPFGMKPESKVLILKDISKDLSGFRKFLMDNFLGENKPFKTEEEIEEHLKAFHDRHDSTDAQGFHTKKRNFDIRKGYATTARIGNSLKPMYFGVTPVEFGEDKIPVPLYIKYSSSTLDTNLTSKFPLYDILAKYADLLDVDEIVFESAVKVGLPTTILSWEDVANIMDEYDKAEDKKTVDLRDGVGIVTIDNNNWGLQQNPIHDPKERVATPTQLLYMLLLKKDTLDEGNLKSLNEINSAFSFLIKKNLKGFKSKLSSKGISGILRDKIMKSENAVAKELVESGVSPISPVLESFSAINFFSGLYNDTIGKIDFHGGKYTLETGANKNISKEVKEGLKLIDSEQDRLVMNTIDMGEQDLIVTEVLLPKGILEKEHEKAVLGKKPFFIGGDGLAFRIPSTGKHSAIVLKVVGFYDDKAKTNVIVAPDELVELHGSDFDVDALFFITPKGYRQTIDDKKSFIYPGYYKESKGLRFDAEKALKDFEKDKEKTLSDIENRLKLAELTPQGEEDIKEESVSTLKKELRTAERRFNKFEEILAHNIIVNGLQETIGNPNDVKTTIVPISMDEYNGKDNPKSVMNRLKKLNDYRLKKGTLNQNSIIGNRIAHRSVHDGRQLVGVFANAMKTFAFINFGGLTASEFDLVEKLSKSKSEENILAYSEALKNSLKSRKLKDVKNTSVKLLKGRGFKFKDGDIEIMLDGFVEEAIDGRSVWDRFDSLVNLAIDNTKEQGLYMIGANNFTSNWISIFTALGLDPYNLALLMRSRIIDYMLETGTPIYSILEDIYKKHPSLKKEKESVVDLSKLTSDISNEDFFSFDEFKDIEDARNYRNVLLHLRRIDTLSEQVKLILNLSNAIGNFPTTLEEIVEAENNLNKVFSKLEFSTEYNSLSLNNEINNNTAVEAEFNPKLWFNIQPMLQNNKYLTVHLEVLQNAIDIARSSFFSSSREMENFLEEIKSSFNVDVDSLPSEVLANQVKLANELKKFLLSSIYMEENSKEEYEFKNARGEAGVVYGNEAWVQKFIKKLSDLQLKDSSGGGSARERNQFLLYLRIRGEGLRRMDFTGNINNDYIGNQQIRADIMGLVNENKLTLRELVKYSALTNGMGYRENNLNKVIPGEALIEAQREQIKLLNKFKFDKKFVKTIEEFFKYSLLLNNSENFKFISGKKAEPASKKKNNRSVKWIKNGKFIYKDVASYTGVTKIITEDGVKNIFYDKGYKPLEKISTKEDFEKTFPKMIAEGKGYNRKLYMRLTEFVGELSTRDVVPYIYLGKPTKLYNFNGVGSMKSFKDMFNGHHQRILTSTKFNSKDSNITIRAAENYNHVENNPVLIVRQDDKGFTNTVYGTIVSSKKIKKEDYELNIKVIEEVKSDPVTINPTELKLESYLLTEETDTHIVYRKEGERDDIIVGYINTLNNKISSASDSFVKYKNLTLKEFTSIQKSSGLEVKLLEKTC